MPVDGMDLPTTTAALDTYCQMLILFWETIFGANRVDKIESDHVEPTAKTMDLTR